MAFPSYETWQAPWEKKGDEFDAEIAKKFIYNLQKEADTVKGARATERQADKDRISELEGKVQEFEDKDLSEVERLRKENERLKDGSAKKNEGTENSEAVRLEIALEKGLTLAQSRRLVGKTREELEADADTFLSEVNGGQKNDEGEQGGDDDDDDDLGDLLSGGEMPSNRQRPPLRGGLGGRAPVETFDPAKMADTIGRY